MILKCMRNNFKHHLFTLLVLAVPLFSLGNGQPSDWFAKGNAQYGKADYQGAVKSYQEILKSGYTSFDVNFNLGNAYYKLGDIPSAILSYERARKLKPGDEEVNQNLQLARLKITDKIEESPELFLVSWWKAFIFFLPASVLAIWSIVFFITGFAILTFYLFASSVSLKKASFFAGIVVAVVGLLFLLMAGTQRHYFNSREQAIVFKGSVPVKSGPQANQKTLFVVHEGTKVNILDTSAGWAKVELPNGNSGWIELSAVQTI